MTEKRFRALVGVWQIRLGLTGWDLTLKMGGDTKVDEQMCLMRVQRSQFYDRATINVHPGVFDISRLPDCLETDLLQELDAAGQDQLLEACLVHELLHCCLRDVMEASDLVREHVAPAATGVWDGAFRRAEETTVEKLSLALVRNWGR